MKCLACDAVLTDREQLQKYRNHEEIKNPEHKYIGLCTSCFSAGQFDDEQLDAYIPEDYKDDPNIFLLNNFRKE